MPALLQLRDPELRYMQGSILAFCGERAPAARLLQSAIGDQYCATDAFANDPLLDKLRPYPEFQRLQSASKDCMKRFLADRGQRVN